MTTELAMQNRRGNVPFRAMKALKHGLALVLLLACCLMVGLAAKRANAQSTRGIYGLISDDGFGDTGDIRSVTLYDDTAHSHYDLTKSVVFSLYYWLPEYNKDGLPTNHQYHVIVTMIDGESGRVDFYLPSGYYNNQKISTLYFQG